MKTIVVGGNFGDKPKASSIIWSLSKELNCDCINGGSFDDIKNVDLAGYKLIIWAPNIDNSHEKIYPNKDIGSILICTKVLREDRTVVDAITRIFTMHGNAVIAIDSNDKPFKLKLLDALGNVWIETTSVEYLCKTILEFSDWTTKAIRKRAIQINGKTFDFSELQEFVDINKQVADIFEEGKGRYFGNSSTRCMKMFPTMKVGKTIMIVSRRNVSKKRITTEDLVATQFGEDGNVEYYGESKPSVDTPIQLALYKLFPKVNYMIHGHSYINGASYTQHYYPCGDMREVESAADLMEITGVLNGVINLVNNGFLIYAESIESLKKIVDGISFVERKVGYEKLKR